MTPFTFEKNKQADGSLLLNDCRTTEAAPYRVDDLRAFLEKTQGSSVAPEDIIAIYLKGNEVDDPTGKWVQNGYPVYGIIKEDIIELDGDKVLIKEDGVLFIAQENSQEFSPIRAEDIQIHEVEKVILPTSSDLTGHVKHDFTAYLRFM